MLTQRSSTSSEVTRLSAPEVPLGIYHISILKLYNNNITDQSVTRLRKHGRPKKNVSNPHPKYLRNQRGRM